MLIKIFDNLDNSFFKKIDKEFWDWNSYNTKKTKGFLTFVEKNSNNIKKIILEELDNSQTEILKNFDKEFVFNFYPKEISSFFDNNIYDQNYLNDYFKFIGFLHLIKKKIKKVLFYSSNRKNIEILKFIKQKYFINIKFFFVQNKQFLPKKIINENIIINIFTAIPRFLKFLYLRRRSILKKNNKEKFTKNLIISYFSNINIDLIMNKKIIENSYYNSLHETLLNNKKKMIGYF